jgi:hypothetical protein
VLRFYRDQYRGRLGKIFVESVFGVQKWYSLLWVVFVSALSFFTRPVQAWIMGTSEGWPVWVVPVFVMASVIVLFVRGLLKENYERFLKIQNEKARLEERLTTKEERRATLDLLGRYHAQGQKIARNNAGVEELPEGRAEEISEWGKGVYSLVRAAYGFGQAEIFLSGENPGDIEVWLRERLAQLVRLMEQTSEMELRPGFDPEDFALQDQEHGSRS